MHHSHSKNFDIWKPAHKNNWSDKEIRNYRHPGNERERKSHDFRANYGVSRQIYLPPLIANNEDWRPKPWAGLFGVGTWPHMLSFAFPPPT